MDLALVALELPELLPRLQVPDPDGVVLADRGQIPAILAEGYPQDHPLVPPEEQGIRLRPGPCGVPDPDASVAPSRRQEGALGAVGEAPRGPGRALQDFA